MVEGKVVAPGLKGMCRSYKPFAGTSIMEMVELLKTLPASTVCMKGIVGGFPEGDYIDSYQLEGK